MFLKQLLLANFLFFALYTMAQAQPKFNYDAAWKKVDDLINKKGLTESALKELQTIYTSALKEKNDAQQIKALVFRVNLQNQKEEEADVMAILQLEKEITKASDPAKSILTNLLAEAYWQYLQNNRWKFYNRTNTVDFKKEDFATWTADDFHKKISSLFLASIQNEKQLKETKLSSFDAIIEKGNMRQLRPTLYDLLVHRAISYFENDERNISKPADAFEINSASAFDPAADFTRGPFVTSDSASLHHKALLLYQKLIAFHSTDKTSEALVDVDIKRLEFVNRYSTLENKNELYRKTLNHLIKQFNNQPFAAQASYLLAKDYADFAATYDFIKHKTDDASNPRWYYKKAIELCKTVIKQKENSEGKVNCNNLILQIQQKELLLNTEKVNIPNQPFRTLVAYKNTPQLWFRVIKVTKDPVDEERENYWDEAYWNKLAKLSPVQSFTYNMPATDDYQTHKTEIKIPALAAGTYLILASANQNFSTGKNMMSAQYVHVSNIAWIHNGNDFFVLNRESGNPLYKATVQIWKQGYDYNKSKYVNTKAESYNTDVNGYFKLKADNNNNFNRRLEINYEKDRLFLDDNVYSYNYQQVADIDELKNRRVFLFTDRSIYRPGQTVYFKGILTTTDAATKKPKIVAGVKTTIVLYDANYQKIDSIKLTTNEFGSYNGKFTLPQGQLNGIFRIKDETVNGEQSFSVEEYKRPKFYVEYLPVKGTFKVNDQIKVTGNAKAYAGNNIDNAKVKYRVVREPRILYPWLCWRWGWPQMDAQEIAHGETVTKADGTFEIVFTAIPDKQVRKELDPVFDYKITADVTDLNGETRSGETEVSVSYKALQLQIVLPKGETMAADSLQYINIGTQNTMGVFEKANVTVTMHRIEAPKRFIRSRFWQQPDQFILKQEEYLTDFPNDEYNDESKKENWKKLEKVFEKSDTSSASSKFPITNSKLPPGWYLIEATTKDKNGQEVKNISFIQLVDAKTLQPIAPSYIWSLPTNFTKEPGEKATIEFGSSATDLFVIQQEDKDLSKDPLYSFITVNNEKKKS